MRTRASRSFAAIVSAVVVIVVAVGILAEPALGQAAPSDGVRIEVLGTEAAGLDQAIGLAGLPHRISVTIALTNAGPTRERSVIAWIETGASAAATAPVDLAPGQTVTTSAEMQVSGLPGAVHDVIVTAGGATAPATHRQVPWLLIGAAVIGVHIAALTGRDRLRCRLARSVAQPSPNQTWARSSR